MQLSQWQSANDKVVQNLPYQVAEWLLEFGSLTEKLKAAVGAEVKLDLLQEIFVAAEPCEQVVLQLTEQEKSRVREVVLHGANSPWIFARTIIPENTAHLVKKLGNKPLGSMLFAGQHLRRQFLQVRKLTAADHLFQLAKQALIKNGGDLDRDYLWARRSLWASHEKNKQLSMLVCEVFLPESPLYK